MAWWPLGRSRRESIAPRAPSAAPVAAPVALPTEPAGAWRDLPNLQRTLAEPLRPVAVGDDFRQSLASFNDPSFVAPLSHHVDPSSGGLVDGLVAPGQPHAHRNVSDLPVPARPAAQSAPRVQRSVAWSGSTDLPTVGWELPGLPADEPVEPGLDSPTEPGSQIEPPTPVPASTTPPPPAGGPVAAVPSQTPLPVQRSLAAVPATPARRGVVPPAPLGELPVIVARSTSDGPTPDVSMHEVQRETPAPTAAPAEPAAEQAPLSGFAEAITSLGGSDEVPTAPPVGPGGADQPPVGPSIQRLTAEGDAGDAAAEVAPSLAQPAPGSPTVAALPVVSRLATPADPGDSSPSTGAGMTRPTSSAPAPRADDAPTLGTGLAQKPLAIQRAPLTGRTPHSAEPPVQRVEFLTPEIATAAGPSMNRIPAAHHADPESSAEPGTAPVAAESLSAVVPTPGATAVPPVQRSVGEAGPTAVAVESAMTEQPRVPFAVGPAPVQRAAEESSHDALDRSPTVDAVPETAGHVEPAEPPTPSGPPDLDAPIGRDDRRRLPDLGDPAVSVEPWVATPAPTQPTSVQRTAVEGTAVRAPAVPTASVQRSATPARSVQASPAPAPFGSAAPEPAAYPSRTVGSSPTVAVGPPIPVQRNAAHLTEAASSPSSAPGPLVVSRQLAANVPPGSSRTGGNLSFASMSTLFAAGSGGRSDPADQFGSSPPADTRGAADGFTSVQLQSADTAAAPSEPVAEPAPPTPSAAPAPAPAGTSPADLDEMARRLYEPLSARLRAELWLDRERAGVMSDA